MTPWFLFWDIGAVIVKSSTFGVMFNYWNVGVQRKLDYSNLGPGNISGTTIMLWMSSE